MKKHVTDHVLPLITVSMPPGVEHDGQGVELSGDIALITVSMPPGVEHSDNKSTLFGFEF